MSTANEKSCLHPFTRNAKKLEKHIAQPYGPFDGKYFVADFFFKTLKACSSVPTNMDI